MQRITEIKECLSKTLINWKKSPNRNRSEKSLNLLLEEVLFWRQEVEDIKSEYSDIDQSLSKIINGRSETSRIGCKKCNYFRTT